ncbi:MAG: hypothetical protein J1E63_06085 [Muribaculaceae bacterium]|nr:hypothetical protein [Muribaculaceae bacterium]
MAKELIFKFAGKDFSAAPVKIERKKIYGWTDTVATDRNGDVCVSAYLSPDDVLIIPSGGLKQGSVSEDGRWLEKGELTAYDEAGENVLPILPSAFDAPIELTVKATIDEFLDNDWESVYQLVNDELAAALGTDIYKFEFSYRGGTNHNDGYLVATPAGLFLFAGDAQEFIPVGLAEETVIDEIEEPEDESIDELDFSMF